jgi:hypothetical protein
MTSLWYSAVQMAAIAPSPLEDLGLLRDRLGSERAVGRVLGKGQRTVWGWLQKEHKLQARSVDLIRGATAVVDRITVERDYAPAELEYVLGTPWDALGGTPPAELIKAGRAEEVLAALGETEVSMPMWKQELRRELDESIRARLEGEGPLREGFVFLRALDEEETMTFAGAARRTLDASADEDAFDAYLAPYWARLTAPQQATAAVIEPDPDEPTDEGEFNIDDLLIIDGGMASLRFLER